MFQSRLRPPLFVHTEVQRLLDFAKVSGKLVRFMRTSSDKSCKQLKPPMPSGKLINDVQPARNSSQRLLQLPKATSAAKGAWQAIQLFAIKQAQMRKVARVADAVW